MNHPFLVRSVRILVLLTGFLLLAAPVYADTLITVTTTADGIAEDGQCGLREAIIAANSDSPIGGCLAGNGADTLVLAANLPQPTIFALTQTGSNEDNTQSGDLDVTGTLTISGTKQLTPGSAPLIIDGLGADRILEIHKGATATLIGVTLRHGKVDTAGGGVLVNLTARLTLTNSQVISNSALTGGGLHTLGRLNLYDTLVQFNQGGGIANEGGLLNLQNVKLLDNTGGYGIRNYNSGVLTFNGGLVCANQGGIYNNTGTATVENVQIISNTGSGIHNTGSTSTRLTLTASTIISNAGVSGGGILNEGNGAKAEIRTTQLEHNQATSSGGGLFNSGIMSIKESTLAYNQAQSGGGLRNFGGNLTLTNVTLSQNHATDNGGGLYNDASATITFATFSGNQADGAGGNLFNDEASLSLSDTIIAQAQAGGNCVNSAGFITSLGRNLEDTATCNLNATGDLANTAPLLGPLEDNGVLQGRPAYTHALLSGSPAIDHSAASGCPATDQRGVARPQGSACDSGAYEVMVAPPITPTVTPTATPTATPTHVPTAPPTPTLVPTTPPVGSVLLKIDPPSPTTRDPISITVSGVYTNSCTPIYATHQLSDTLLAIRSQLPEQSFCLPAEFPWGYTLKVGPLAAGTYTVTHTLQGRVDRLVFSVAPPLSCVEQAAAQALTAAAPVAQDERWRSLARRFLAAPVKLFFPAVGNEMAAGTCR